MLSTRHRVHIRTHVTHLLSPIPSTLLDNYNIQHTLKNYNTNSDNTQQWVWVKAKAQANVKAKGKAEVEAEARIALETTAISSLKALYGLVEIVATTRTIWITDAVKGVPEGVGEELGLNTLMSLIGGS
uniref:WGS project CBMI000000000 data, contig CS3069_c004218 n=1 Tax=Fusarium clavum TaxID=2594811 RepID=A0A090N617_9HYPO|nr:unnamed protein product [Fusarium clavum]CEG05952.1 unnamed protein product [Fusarium clavum]